VSATAGTVGRAPALAGLRRLVGSQEAVLLIAIILLFAVVGTINPRFVAERNLQSILLGNAYIAVAAIGMSMVIVSGNIDISVGALIGVLATMLGLNVRVRAMARGGSGPRTVARPASTDPPPGAGGRAGSPGGATDRPDDSTGGPGARGGAGRTGAATPGDQASASGRQAPAGEPDGTAAVGGPGRRASAGPRTPGPRAGVVRAGQNSPAAADLEQEWPDDAGPADTVARPTGMELIERQLGGTVIEEIEET